MFTLTHIHAFKILLSLPERKNTSFQIFIITFKVMCCKKERLLVTLKKKIATSYLCVEIGSSKIKYYRGLYVWSFITI